MEIVTQDYTATSTTAEELIEKLTRNLSRTRLAYRTLLLAATELNDNNVDEFIDKMVDGSLSEADVARYLQEDSNEPV